MSNHMLVTYTEEQIIKGRANPNYTYLTYVDGRLRDKVGIGSFVFFNTPIYKGQYITAYFYVERVLLSQTHPVEMATMGYDAKVDDAIIIGNRSLSKVLTMPLYLGRTLLKRLPSLEADPRYYNAKLLEGYTEVEATRLKLTTPQFISEEEKEFLLKLCKQRG